MKYNEYLRDARLPTFWCAGCGYGQVMNSMARALEKVNASLEKTVMVSGIGCWGHVDSYFKTNAFHGTHGRALAFATGIKLSNPELTVIVVMGDGDGATIGGNHLIHACRRNIDVTAIVCNNYNYGMTGGQYSGTTPEYSITTTSRLGHIEHGFDLSALAIASGAPFVARTISENVLQNADLIAQAINKKGFSFIEVITPCTTHFGNNNNMRRPSELYRWIKSNSVPVAAAAKLPPEKLVGKFTIGKLHEHEAIDYSTRYQQVQAKAKALVK